METTTLAKVKRPFLSIRFAVTIKMAMVFVDDYDDGDDNNDHELACRWCWHLKRGKKRRELLAKLLHRDSHLRIELSGNDIYILIRPMNSCRFLLLPSKINR